MNGTLLISIGFKKGGRGGIFRTRCPPLVDLYIGRDLRHGVLPAFDPSRKGRLSGGVVVRDAGHLEGLTGFPNVAEDGMPVHWPCGWRIEIRGCSASK